jgi:hypothetical protein
MFQGSDFQRYDESELWIFHDYYFKNIGLKAWDSGAIPFAGATNYNEARKKALLLIENLRLCGLENSDDTIKILEIGAGSGAFAENFLLAFENICLAEDLNFHKRLKYFLTDYSQFTLDELQRKKRLKEFPNIIFQSYDVLENTQSSSLSASAGSFHCILSTYLLDQLPCRVVAKIDNKYKEKYLKLIIPEKYLNDARLLNEKLLKKSKWIKKIKKVFHYEEIDDEDDIPAEDFEILKTCFRNSKESTTIYSYGAKIALENSFKLLHPKNGLIIASDFNAATRGGVDLYEPCYYGNSLAQPVNFDFLYKSFAKQQKVVLFEDPIRPLHTLIICAENFEHPLRLGITYERVFKQNMLLRMFYQFLLEIKQSIHILLIISILYITYYIFTLYEQNFSAP